MHIWVFDSVQVEGVCPYDLIAKIVALCMDCLFPETPPDKTTSKQKKQTIGVAKGVFILYYIFIHVTPVLC